MSQFVLRFTGYFTVEAPDEETARELVDDLNFGISDLVDTTDNGVELSELKITSTTKI